MKMTKADLPANTEAPLADDLLKVYAAYEDDKSPSFVKREIDKGAGVWQVQETAKHKRLRMDVMKAALRNPIQSKTASLTKGVITTASNFTPYDLQAPSHHLVPWLSPLVESTPRVSRPSPGTAAHWKSVIAASSSYTRGSFGGMPWVNEGQRAPQIGNTALNVSANYTTIGREGSLTWEAESSSVGFEDARAMEHFFTLETLRVMEEDSLLGGNNSLALGTANKPVGSATGTGSFTGTYYAAVVGLTYEGYRNFVLQNGLNTTGTFSPIIPAAPAGLQQQSITVTPDGKTMTINGGMGIASATSTTTAAPSSNTTATFTWTAKTGEVAWAIYIGTSNTTSAMYLTAITNVSNYSFTAAPATTGQTLSSLTATDFSQNNGSTGGGINQVTAFDGILTQAFNNTTLSPQNAYVSNLAGAALTTTGKGNVVEIDTMLQSMWNLYKVGPDVLWVNAQEMTNITSRVLNGSSAPLLRIEKPQDSEQGFDVTGSGIISFYFNPYMPGGGKKMTIMIHPTIPPGTMVAYAKTLPPFYKSNATPNVLEVLTRRDYYSYEWPPTTREWQHGVYAEEVLAVYAPFCFGIITNIGNA